jgi:hypothetical protein
MACCGSSSPINSNSCCFLLQLGQCVEEVLLDRSSTWKYFKRVSFDVDMVFVATGTVVMSVRSADGEISLRGTGYRGFDVLNNL